MEEKKERKREREPEGKRERKRGGEKEKGKGNRISVENHTFALRHTYSWLCVFYASQGERRLL